MIVCICANINEQTVREMLSKMSLSEFKKQTGACQNCCKCSCTLNQITKEIKQPHSK